MWVRVVLALSAVPIAVAANGFRIFGTGLLVQYWDPDKAQGFFHTFSGWLIYVVALFMLFCCAPRDLSGFGRAARRRNPHGTPGHFVFGLWP